ncbi:hypothetical protein [Colwellia maritima]|nr:hypothetical protein [Colwellia maritima]
MVNQFLLVLSLLLACYFIRVAVTSVAKRVALPLSLFQSISI